MRAVCALAVLLFSMGAASGDSPNVRAMRRALALLPRLPTNIDLTVTDAEEAEPGVRERLLTLEAFIIRGGGRVIYIVKQGSVLRGAAKGSREYTYVLAGIIWHEMAHIAGADERAARKAERDLWATFVRDQRIDEGFGLRYLKLLDSQSLEVIDQH